MKKETATQFNEHNHEPDTNSHRYLMKDAAFITRLRDGTSETIPLKSYAAYLLRKHAQE
jgi:hypothetical protein